MSGWSSPTKIRKKFRLNCERKIGHDTHASAFAAMEEVRQAGKLYDQTALVYLCRRCGKYHWGRPMNEGQMALANGQIGPNPPYKPSP